MAAKDDTPMSVDEALATLIGMLFAMRDTSKGQEDDTPCDCPVCAATGRSEEPFTLEVLERRKKAIDDHVTYLRELADALEKDMQKAELMVSVRRMLNGPGWAALIEGLKQAHKNMEVNFVITASGRGKKAQTPH